MRAKCPECKRLVAVDPNGRLGYHQRSVRGNVACGGFELTATCKGFGMLAVIKGPRQRRRRGDDLGNRLVR